jgi:hypothetical protein
MMMSRSLLKQLTCLTLLLTNLSLFAGHKHLPHVEGCEPSFLLNISSKIPNLFAEAIEYEVDPVDFLSNGFHIQEVLNKEVLNKDKSRTQAYMAFKAKIPNQTLSDKTRKLSLDHTKTLEEMTSFLFDIREGLLMRRSKGVLTKESAIEYLQNKLQRHKETIGNLKSKSIFLAASWKAFSRGLLSELLASNDPTWYWRELGFKDSDRSTRVAYRDFDLSGIDLKRLGLAKSGIDSFYQLVSKGLEVHESELKMLIYAVLLERINKSKLKSFDSHDLNEISDESVIQHELESSLSTFKNWEKFLSSTKLEDQDRLALSNAAESLFGVKLQDKDGVTKERQISHRTYTIEEQIPLVGMFRGFIAKDCSNDSAAYCFLSHEKIFFVFDDFGHAIAYVGVTVVGSKESSTRKIWYLHDVAGGLISKNGVTDVVHSMYAYAKSKGIELIIADEHIHSMNNSRPEHEEALVALIDRTKPSRQIVYLDDEQRSKVDSVLRSHSIANSSVYDTKDNHRHGFDILLNPQLLDQLSIEEYQPADFGEESIAPGAAKEQSKKRLMLALVLAYQGIFLPKEGNLDPNYKESLSRLKDEGNEIVISSLIRGEAYEFEDIIKIVKTLGNPNLESRAEFQRKSRAVLAKHNLTLENLEKTYPWLLIQGYLNCSDAFDAQSEHYEQSVRFLADMIRGLHRINMIEWIFKYDGKRLINEPRIRAAVQKLLRGPPASQSMAKYLIAFSKDLSWLSKTELSILNE